MILRWEIKAKIMEKPELRTLDKFSCFRRLGLLALSSPIEALVQDPAAALLI